MRFLMIFFSLLFSSMVAACAHLSNVVVFGDSLSDNGNVYQATEGKQPASPPYFKGRFSNGPVWVEQWLSSLFPKTEKLPLENFAFGGAVAVGDTKAMNLDREMTMYLNGHQGKANANSLYVIWIGANDYLGNKSEPDVTLRNVNKKIEQGMKKLLARGARHFLIINIPDLGKSPAARAAGAETALSKVTRAHNKKLANLVRRMNTKRGAQFIYLDVNTQFADIVAHPEKAGFTNVRDNCLEAKVASCDNWFFYDSLHPSQKTHSLIGKAVADALVKAKIDIRASD